MFYSKGGCPRDRFCKFAHGVEELQSAPDLTRTKMCPALLRAGVCRRGISCKFAHSESELRPIREVMPEPALAAALLAAWQQKSERWGDFSTDASDDARSEVSSLDTIVREPLVMYDDLADSPVGISTRCSSEVLVVENSFVDTVGQLKEGMHLFHAPTGMPLVIRNTFFDMDYSPRGIGSKRRCCSADARFVSSHLPMD